MKILLKLIDKNIRIYLNSFISIHVSILVLSSVIWHISKYYSSTLIDMRNYSEILNGMGVLTAFFILALDKIEVVHVKKKFSSIVSNYKGNDITEGAKLTNTIFSIVMSVFIILAIEYIMLLWNKQSIYLLTLLIVNIFSGFLLMLSVWHAIEN